MDEIKIEYVSIDSIKPYKKNARIHGTKSVDAIANSIQEFGMADPIAVWHDVIVEGHGRLMALKKLGYKKVPIIRLDYMTDEQRRGYTHAHNKTQEYSEWDFDLLPDELNNIFGIDMRKFGFDISGDEPEEDPEEKEKHNEAERTGNAYNLGEYDEQNTEGFYQMPVLEPCGFVPDDIIGFNYALTSKHKDCGIHFYIDDYQFERIWNQPQMYLEKLSEYECIFTPDFSLYTDMPIAMQIWNIYRSRLIGQMAQRLGMLVIPTVSWCREESFAFSFDGLPKRSTLSISTIGVKKEDYNFGLWKAGVDEMIRRLKPKTLLIYGGKVEYDYGDIKTIYFENKVTERMKRK